VLSYIFVVIFFFLITKQEIFVDVQMCGFPCESLYKLFETYNYSHFNFLYCPDTLWVNEN